MFDQISDIFIGVLLPVLTMVGLGALIERLKGLSVDTMVALNLYLFVPAFLYVRIRGSELSWASIGGIGVVVLLPVAMLGLATYALLRSRGVSGRTTSAMIVGGCFFNAGNFGIPVAQLAFGDAGGGVQALVVMFMNTTIFFVGYAVLAMGQGKGMRSVLGYFKLPMIYVIVAALAMREYELTLPTWLGTAVQTIAGGMVPIALITLGAQLALRARWPRWAVIAPVLTMKLALLPLLTAGVVLALDAMGWDLWPWPGAQLILAAAGPTAVNTLLLTVHLEGDADAAADCVFWTTILCAITVTITLTLIKLAGGGPVPV